MIEADILAWALILVAFLAAVIHQQHLVTRVIKQNAEFLKGADQRLAMANEMVLEGTKSVRTIAESADKLAVTILDMKELMRQIRKEDSELIAEIKASRDKFEDAYVKLLHRYEIIERELHDLDNEYKSELKSLVNRPTISNFNLPEQTTLT